MKGFAFHQIPQFGISIISPLNELPCNTYRTIVIVNLANVRSIPLDDLPGFIHFKNSICSDSRGDRLTTSDSLRRRVMYRETSSHIELREEIEADQIEKHHPAGWISSDKDVLCVTRLSKFIVFHHLHTVQKCLN